MDCLGPPHPGRRCAHRPGPRLMFTGLVTAVGTVTQVTRTARGLRIAIRSPYRDLETGESIAVDGACLTVVSKVKGLFAVEAIGTTRGRTKVSDYAAGTTVNL